MNERLTPYPELDVVLKEYTGRIRKALVDNFIGFYLQGSLAIGDFDLTSDVDFIIVTKEELSEKEVVDVQKAHTYTRNLNTRWVKHMEYSFFPLEKLRINSSPFLSGKPNKSEERMLWYFNNGSHTLEKSDHDNSLVVRWTVREKGVAVLGPDPKTLINPIDPNDLRKEIKGTLTGWGQEVVEDPEPYRNRFYQAYLVLNFSRMLQDLHEGRVTSKLEGINWAKTNLDPKWIPLIDFCWEERQDTEINIGQPADPQVYKKSIEFVGYTVKQGINYKIG